MAFQESIFYCFAFPFDFLVLSLKGCFSGVANADDAFFL